MTLDEEKEKLHCAHKLQVRRIWLDKFLLAVLIGLAGLAGNFIFEGYKSDLAKTRFLLETRLEALKDLRVAFSRLAQHAFAETVKDPNANPDTYSQEVRAFMHGINRWGFLFSDDFTRELTHHAWFHQAIAGANVQLDRDHWGFLMDLAQAFDAATRTALEVEVLGTPRQSQGEHFRIRMWASEDVMAKGTAKLFYDNFEKWQQEKKTR